jgi:hypothetical protein
VAAIRVANRLARAGPILKFSDAEVDLRPWVAQLAALATTDVLQAVAAAHAHRAARQRHRFAGNVVVFSSVGLVETATVDLLLQMEQAVTVDFKHGSGGESWFGQTETSSTYCAVWTDTDATPVLACGQHPIVTPLSLGKPERRRRAILGNILIISNYVHEDWRGQGFPLRPFQEELLRIVPIVETRFPARFTFRWRPHPDDAAELVAATFGRQVQTQLSERSLDADIEWADVIVVSPSSTLVHALCSGAAVFVQTPPSARLLPQIQAVNDFRKFFYAEEFAAQFEQLVAEIDAGSPYTQKPEAEALEVILGDGHSGDLVHTLLSLRSKAKPR